MLLGPTSTCSIFQSHFCRSELRLKSAMEWKTPWCMYYEQAPGFGCTYARQNMAKIGCVFPKKTGHRQERSDPSLAVCYTKKKQAKLGIKEAVTPHSTGHSFHCQFSLPWHFVVHWHMLRALARRYWYPWHIGTRRHTAGGNFVGSLRSMLAVKLRIL